jgi:DNA-binding MarR family transcriptional regulator
MNKKNYSEAELLTDSNISKFGRRVLQAFPYKPGYGCFLGLIELTNRTSSNNLAIISACRRLQKQGLVQIEDGDRHCQKHIHLTKSGMTAVEKLKSDQET